LKVKKKFIQKFIVFFLLISLLWGAFVPNILAVASTQEVPSQASGGQYYTRDAVLEAARNGTLDGLVEGASAGALTAFFNRLATGARPALSAPARAAETVSSEMPAV